MIYAKAEAPASFFESGPREPKPSEPDGTLCKCTASEQPGR